MYFYKTCYQFIQQTNIFLATPSVILFLGTALFLTIKTGLPQFRALKHFFYLIITGIKKEKNKRIKTINPFQALFTAMATTIGIGNVVGPSMAISLGGPGALFWLIIYIFFGSVTKLVEVTFSVHSRTISPKGDIIGGPAQYLKLVNPYLGIWYAALTVFLFVVWSSVQVNTISCICSLEGIPPWLSGFTATLILLIVVLGGVKRIGMVASKLVPIMFILYVIFASIILLKNISILFPTIKFIIYDAFSFKTTPGSLAGIIAHSSMREGIYKGIFITESGIGTSSIAHALSDVKKPIDQGILAMYSALADILLCLISGLLTLVTGIWLTGKLNNTLIYEAFKLHIPFEGGQLILIAAIFLFVLTTLIGNTFNGSQSFAYFTNYKYIKPYFIFAGLVAFSGAFMAIPFIWNLMDIILVLVAIPNLIGIIILTFKHPEIIKFEN